MDGKVVLVTGAARRIGSEIARELHARGAQLLIHSRRSVEEAEELTAELNAVREDSAHHLQADLLDASALTGLARAAVNKWGQLDGLVNNASSFHPTPIGEISEDDWLDLAGSNFKAPLFLTQSLVPALRETHGAVVNIVDVHAQRSLAQHCLYTAAKAALASLTRGLARDLAPQIRVNGVAPGVILWPENNLPAEQAEQALVKRLPLQRQGEPADIARAVRFLLSEEARYITGQILAVDGGASLI